MATTSAGAAAVTALCCACTTWAPAALAGWTGRQNGEQAEREGVKERRGGRTGTYRQGAWYDRGRQALVGLEGTLRDSSHGVHDHVPPDGG